MSSAQYARHAVALTFVGSMIAHGIAEKLTLLEANDKITNHCSILMPNARNVHARGRQTTGRQTL